jgi:hypothetical protein
MPAMKPKPYPRGAAMVKKAHGRIQHSADRTGLNAES